MPKIDLVFSGTIGLVIFSLCFLLYMAIYRTKLNTSTFELGFSASNSIHAQGFFIAVVVIHHIAQRLSDGALASFKGYGYFAVGVFFLLSGYGLTKSIGKNSHYLNGFLKNKFFAVVLPFLIINLITTVLVYIFYRDTFLDFFLYAFSLRMIDSTSWFIVTIFMFYAFFYLGFSRNNGWVGFRIVAVLIGLYMYVGYKLGINAWMYNSSLCFPAGVVLGLSENYFNILIRKYHFSWVVVLGALASLLITLAFPNILWRLHASVICVIFAVSTYVLLSFVSLNTSVGKMLGMFSLEVYLIHMKLLLLFSFFTMVPSFLWCVLYFSTLTYLAYIFMRCHKRIASISWLPVKN